MASIHKLIQEAFPDVTLESQIQGWAYLERFQEGVDCYSLLSDPSPQDDRWVGVCYYQLVRDADAIDALERAIERGEEGARINLAHLLPFLERGDEANEVLSRVNFEILSEYDKALFHRVQSIREETSGNLREALKAAEQAWKTIQGIPEYGVLAPSILAQLAILYGRIGRSQRALWFIERGLSNTGRAEQLKVRLRRAAVLVGLGRFQEAQLELESTHLSTASEMFQVERNWLLGEISLSQGNTRDAIQKYHYTIELASRLGFNYEELLARLSLVAILGSRKDFAGANEHITRAQELISDKADRLSFRFREVLLMLWQGRYTPAHAMEELEDLIESFGDMGLLQEQAAVRLHRVDLLRTLGRPYSTELDDLQALSVSLQNPSILAREWAALPELRAIAKNTHPRIVGAATSVIEVHTLGREEVLLDGEAVHIPLRRGVEVLAYLLERKAVTLQNVMDDVFPNEKPSSAKSYFHQFRHQLREHVDGLEIEFDSEAKMYRLTSEINVIWDVAELRSGRFSGAVGEFLPTSVNEWKRAVQDEVDGLSAAGSENDRDPVEPTEPEPALV